jgi:hypothetical protein
VEEGQLMADKPWDKYKKAGSAGASAVPSASPKPWEKFKADNWADDDDLDEDMVAQPDLGFLPGPFGHIARSIGYDGIPREKEEGYEPSSVPVLDPLSTMANRAVEAVPIVGPAIADAGRGLEEKVYGEAPGTREQIEAANASQYPNAALAGDITGTIGPLGLLGSTAIGGRVLGMTGGLAGRTLAGGTSGAAIAGLDSYARNGGDMPDAMRDAALGGTVGAGLPLLAKTGSLLWGGVKSALSKSANAGLVDDEVSSQLQDMARTAFRQADESGVGVTPQSFSTFVDGAVANSKSGTFKVNPRLDEKASALFDELGAVRDELATSGKAITLGDLHELRMIAQKVAQSGEGRDATFASKLIEKLDDYVGGLSQADVTSGADPTKGAQALQDGIATWAQAKKAATIEEAMFKARHAASGYENGLRVQFRSILNNKNKRQGFTDDELNAIAEVADGTVGANLSKLIGKFGFGSGNASNMMGGAVGLGLASTLGGGPHVGAVLSAGATGTRALSEKLTRDAASRALGATKNGVPGRVLSGVSGVSGPKTMSLGDYAKQVVAIRGGGLPLNAPAAAASVEAARAY